MAYPTKSLPKVMECALCREWRGTSELHTAYSNLDMSACQQILNDVAKENNLLLLTHFHRCEFVRTFNIIDLAKGNDLS